MSTVLRSHYPHLEVIIVDDGSSDATWTIAKELATKKRVRALTQNNSGKGTAINRGIRAAKGEIIVSIDADTLFLRGTISKLVRHFHNENIGAVAGVVKVGNVNNWITRWQALEYVTSISIERASQAYLRAIFIAPGACSAWRKKVVLKAGGFSSNTLAEDCDLTLAVHKLGYQVMQDMQAVAYTESPETIHSFAKQRFRWLYGTSQSLWKHRDMMFRRRYGWLGMYVMPKALLGIIMQILFAPILFFVGIGNMIAGDFLVVLFYVAVTLGVLLVTSIIALILAKEKFTFLAAVPVFRILYSPMRNILLYVTIVAALGGLEIGWNKLIRSGSAAIK